MKIEELARIVHEANRAHCMNLGDLSQRPWDFAEDWQKDSAIAGIKELAKNPLLNPIDMHASWCAYKDVAGWVYGPVKDAELKTHPCMVAYRDLPEEQRAKDTLFSVIVKAFLDDLEWDECYDGQMTA